ncbi:hypothetical protein KDW75_gp52 [Mycobacterium phage Mercurio]|uniref:Uncharacterized protein n=1 Tax=Mycobacterium phage Mercurio TaxID=2575612 RepID=A0A5J6T6G0_9CAUD|nr:hypothetical protein KDW75_gp52 [Mycobacterium phage Mercurio]QFG06054.1 hypothetical protein PBI_MERCURIO_52 [Mycobacterium phage Mercurio]
MAGERENVAIFNPLTLPLPVWHPDGPDGTVDGYVIPFVFVEQRLAGPVENRRAQFRVYPTEFGWRAALRNCQDHAETAEQARAFAAGWLRAAELLEAEALRAAKLEAERRAADDDVVDCEVVEDDDEDQGDAPAPADGPKSSTVLRADQLVIVTGGDHWHVGRRGRIVESQISENEPITYDVLLEPDQARMRGFETIRFEAGVLRRIVDGCPACSAGTCTLHGGEL